MYGIGRNSSSFEIAPASPTSHAFQLRHMPSPVCSEAFGSRSVSLCIAACRFATDLSFNCNCTRMFLWRGKQNERAMPVVLLISDEKVAPSRRPLEQFSVLPLARYTASESFPATGFPSSSEAPMHRRRSWIVLFVMRLPRASRTFSARRESAAHWRRPKACRSLTRQGAHPRVLCRTELLGSTYLSIFLRASAFA